MLFALFSLGIMEIIILALCSVVMIAVPVIIIVVVMMASKSSNTHEHHRRPAEKKGSEDDPTDVRDKEPKETGFEKDGRDPGTPTSGGDA